MALVNVLTYAQQSRGPLTAIADSTIVSIAGENIPAKDFLYMFDKDNSSGQYSTERYLEMFVTFRLKVHAAKAQGIDTTTTFQHEYRSYRNQAIRKYMRDDEALEVLCREAYDRMSRDRKVAHIAVECRDTTDQVRRDSAYNVIKALRARVVGSKKKQPENFFAVAASLATDSAMAADSGRLGWITPFKFVYPLENVAYNTPVGQVSEIFSTPYGFHILYVEQEIPHIDVHSAHIMFRAAEGYRLENIRAQKDIDTLYEMLLEGEDFAALAREISDDKGSASKGGDLGWSTLSLMTPVFEQAIAGVQPGHITKPFKSEYGWHIAKVLETKPLASYEQLRDEIMASVGKDVRVIGANKSFVEKMKKEYKLPDTMSIQGVYQYVEEHVQDHHPDLVPLLKEYYDGILLFDISEEQVWGKASNDTVGLQAFFQQHKSEFPWQTHFKGYKLQCTDESVLSVSKTLIANASGPEEAQEAIRKRLTIEDYPFALCEYGSWSKGQDSIVDVYGFKDTTLVLTPSTTHPTVAVVGKLLPAPEDYTDVKTDVVTGYQKYLDALWVRNLLQQYPVVINKSVVDAIKAVKDTKK